MDYNKVAKEVISHVGGPKNIKKAFHCATRLRLMLKDPSLADEKALESVDGVKGTFLVQEPVPDHLRKWYCEPCHR